MIHASSSARNFSKHLLLRTSSTKPPLSELDKKVILIRKLVDKFYYTQRRTYSHNLFNNSGLNNNHHPILQKINTITHNSSTSGSNNTRSYSSTRMMNSSSSTSTSSEGKKILLVDGTPLVVRAYHGTPPLTSSNGTPTNAVLTFAKSLIAILKSEEFDHVAIFFDSGKPSIRKTISSDYKANRKPTDDGLKKQFPLCKLLVEKMGLKVISKDGFEADDLIATVAKQAHTANYSSIVVVSSDKDLHCLSDTNVTLLDPMTKKKLSMNDIIEKYDLPPKLIPEFLALVGDTADNIKGVKGIGKKKAVALLEQYGSISEILKNLDDSNMEKKSREAIKNNTDDLNLSLKLVTLDEDVSMDYTLQDYKIEESTLDFSQNEPLIKFLEELEINSVVKQLKKTEKTETKKEKASVGSGSKKKKEIVESVALNEEMSSADVASLKKSHSTGDSKISKTAQSSEYNIILNEKELDNFIEQVKQEGSVCFSTEICLLSLHNPVLAGISFCIKPGSAYYLPFFKGGRVEFLESLDILKDSPMLNKVKVEIMENPNILKIGHNIKHNIKMLANYGVSLQNFDDIQVMSYVLNCGKHGHDLDEIVENVLSFDPKEYLIPEKEVVGIGKKKVTLLEADIVSVVHFACQHADVTKQAYDILKEELGKSPKLTQFYEGIEKPLVETLAGIEMKGVYMDEPALQKMEIEYREKIKSIGNKIREDAGYDTIDEDIEIPTTEEEIENMLIEMDEKKQESEEFNINSNRQLGQVIFDKLRIGGKFKKKTKVGDYILNAEVLEKLASEGHSIAKHILEYRALTKLYSTYISGLRQHINPYTKRIHTTFQNALTVTGRLSSVMPNIQNIPVRTSAGKQIRRCFIAPSDDYVLMKVDYSQVELRILAHIANIPVLKNAFKENKDVHAITASQVFNVPLDQVDKATRNKAKAINFGIIYGMSEFGLSKRIGVDTQAAKSFIEQYFKQYPGIKNYMTKTIDFCRKHGYVNTLFNRRCWIPGINDNVSGKSSFSERTSINTPIQGTSADITKIAMNSLHKAFKEKGLRTRMIIQVHDEIVFEVPKDEVEIVQPIITELMEGAAFFAGTNFTVPLTVEATVDSKWLADE